MRLELNNTGYFNLIKPGFFLERLLDSEKNAFKITLTDKEFNFFLSINEIWLNEKSQVTDGSEVFGFVNYFN